MEQDSANEPMNRRLKVLLALALVLICGLSLMAFQTRKNGFDNDQHGFLSGHGMALAASILSHETPVTVPFMEKYADSDGKVRYLPYTRFPFFSFWFISKAIESTSSTVMADQIFVARQLMNVFYLLAMLTAFAALTRLMSDPFASAMATILAFSSYPLLYYSDMIFNDTPSLFGMMFAVLLFAFYRRDHTLGWGKSCLAIIPISMGWQPFAVFGVWIVVDSLFWARSLGWRELASRRIVSLLKRPPVRFAIVGIVWGIFILGTQLAMESHVQGVAFMGADSFKSMMVRLGMANRDEMYQSFGEGFLNTWPFAKGQGIRLANVLLPFGATLPRIQPGPRAVLYVCILIASLALVWFIAAKRQKDWHAAGLVLFLSGFMWAIPMKFFVAFHEFQAIYYIGASLAFYAMASSLVDQRWRQSIAVVVCGLFIVSVWRMNRLKTDARAYGEAITSQFQDIRKKLPAGAKLWVNIDNYNHQIPAYAVSYFLMGSYMVDKQERADYVVTAYSDFKTGTPLTHNKHVNIFQMTPIGPNSAATPTKQTEL
ncbi:MAG: hypothetical protein M3Q07_10855 [Pseudobdellovibrionaceae bacterium]|nr:hypothetical protein [Pseudobdellovibrionaceae bacterium]